jgi:MFS family permease
MIGENVDGQPLPVQEPGFAHVYPRQTAGFYLELSVFWFAISFLWAGMITIVIQTLVADLAGPKKDLYLGWTLAVGALISTVVVIVVGTMSDRSRWAMGRRRPYIIAGTLLSVPALLWLSQVNTLLGVFLAFCAIQLWVNLATSPYQALVPDLVPKEKQGTAAAYLGLGSLLGQLGGLILCGMLIRKPGGLLIIMATLSFLLVATMLYTALRVHEQPATDNSLPRLGPWATLKHSFDVSPRAHPDFFWLIASRFVINMGFYSATEFLLYYVTDTLGAPKPVDVVTQIFVITTISGLLGNFPSGILSDRVSKKLVVYISAAITATAALVFLLASSINVALGAAFIFGAGFGAFMAVDWALATNLLPEHDEAKYMGIWHVAFTVPQVVAPFIGGMVAYYFNHRIHSLFGHDLGPGFGYRVVLFLVIIYFGIGVLLLRPVRERVIPKAKA